MCFDADSFQVSTTELMVSWESFTDVEEHGESPHHSGIKEYQFAIGKLGCKHVHNVCIEMVEYLINWIIVLFME